jgi:neutral trehalase
MSVSGGYAACRLVPMLEARASHFRSLIAQHLWDAQSGAFVNRLRHGGFYRRVSPTSFYALGAGAATDAQAEAFVKRWLLNASRFGITPGARGAKHRIAVHRMPCLPCLSS